MTGAQFKVLALLVVVSGLVGGALSGWLFTGRPAFAEGDEPVQSVVTAHELRIVSPGGKLLASLGPGHLSFAEAQQVALRFYDAQGAHQAKFGLSRAGYPTLSMWDPKSHRRVTLDVADFPRLSFVDGEGRTLIKLGLLEGGYPMLGFYNEQERRQLHLGVIGNTAVLGLCNVEGNPLAGLSVASAANEPQFILSDGEGHTLFSAP
jgi:hypothetical protein